MIKAAAVIRCSRSGGLPLNPAGGSFPWCFLKVVYGLAATTRRPFPSGTLEVVLRSLFRDLVQVRGFNWGRDGSINLRRRFVIPGSPFSVPRELSVPRCSKLLPRDDGTFQLIQRRKKATRTAIRKGQRRRYRFSIMYRMHPWLRASRVSVRAFGGKCTRV